MSGRALHLRPGTGGWAAGQLPGAALLFALLGGCGEEGPVRLGEVVTVVASGASNPTVAAGEDGVFYVAWVGAGGGEADVWLARSEDGVVFSAPVRVNDVAGDAAPHEQAPAQVAVGPGGEVYVVWQNNTVAEGRRFPYSDLRFARSEDGGRTFSPAVTVNDDAAGPPSSHTFQSLAVARDGTVLVAWIDGRARTAAELALESEGGALEPGGMHHGSGGPVLPGSQIRLARSEDGGRTFQASVVLADVACPCCRTAIAIGPDGVVNVAWRDVAEGEVRDVVVARSEDGGRSFGPASVVHADGWHIEGCPHAGPALAYDAAGQLHIGWYTGAESGPGLYHAVSEDGGGTFGAPNAVLTGDWVPVSLVSLAADTDGRVWAAWDDRRTEPLMTRIARLDVGGPGAVVATVPGKAPSLAAGSGVIAGVIDGETVRMVGVGRSR